MKLYILDSFPQEALDEAIKQLGKGWEFIISNEKDRIDNWYKDADALVISGDTKLPAGVFEKLSNTAEACLKVIVKMGAGMDRIDLVAAKKCGVKVYNTPGVNAESVAELSVALALAVSRRITTFDRYLRNGQKLVRSELLGRSLFRPVVGLIGMGAVSRAAAVKWIGAFNGIVHTYDPYVPEDAWTHGQDKIPHVRAKSTKEGLHTMLAKVDLLSVHAPLTPDTRHMIGKGELRLLNSKAIVINTARGAIIDEQALIESLSSKSIYGAGLDTLEVEPPTKESTEKLLSASENVVITPHVGSRTEEVHVKCALAAVETLKRVFVDRMTDTEGRCA